MRKEEFLLNLYGKTYTFEDSVDECKSKNGDIMLINYDQVIPFVNTL